MREFKENEIIYDLDSKRLYKITEIDNDDIFGVKLDNLHSKEVWLYQNEILSLEECADIISNVELQQLILTYKK